MTITKADVAIAELGTDFGTEHRENDAHKRDMVEQLDGSTPVDLQL
ncbi:MAG TPA: hypothetical protein VEF72_07100 [Mycobacterium sp.]|nr:hypothetical protein [Mycobacterium sp.]